MLSWISENTQERYEIIEEIGRGGMATVYLGIDHALAREVAIKILHPHLAQRRESRKRFKREAQAVARLKHPNIVEIYDFSDDDSDEQYIVTEFIDGFTITELIERCPIEFPEIGTFIIIKVCEAIKHAHQLGVIHRDVKPENIMISCTGEVKLMDFGIAHIVEAQKMTVTGTILGSPAHMPPEMIEGLPVDFRADIFSVGTLLYFLTTNSLPFEGPNAPSVMRALLEGNYTPAEYKNPRIGKKLSRIINKCLEHLPVNRFENVGQLIDELHAYIKFLDVEDVDGELRKYFSQPEEYLNHFRQTLLEKLENNGVAALKKSQVAKALEYFNRALAIEGTNSRILRQLRKLERRRRARGYLISFLVLVLLVTLAYILTTSIAGTPQENKKTTQFISAVQPDPIIEPIEVVPPEIIPQKSTIKTTHLMYIAGRRMILGLKSSRKKLALKKKHAKHYNGKKTTKKTHRKTGKNNHKVKSDPNHQVDPGTKKTVDPKDPEKIVEVKPPVEKIELLFKIWPMTATLYIDGKQEVPAIDKHVKLTPGRHEIVIKSDGCHDWRTTVEIVPGKTPQELRKQLKWKEATLIISSDPSAFVKLDNRANPVPVGQGIKISINDSSGREIVKYQLLDENFRSRLSGKVELKAGETKTITLPFAQ